MTRIWRSTHKPGEDTTLPIRTISTKRVCLVIFLIILAHACFACSDHSQSDALRLDMNHDVAPRADYNIGTDTGDSSWPVPPCNIPADESQLSIFFYHIDIKSSPASYHHVDDYNGDGFADLLVRNLNNGLISINYLKGDSIISSKLINDIGLEWRLEATGDFDGDNYLDLFFQNTHSMETKVFLLNKDGSLKSAGFLDKTQSKWAVGGVGDFDGDGKSDILFEDQSTPEYFLYAISGFTLTPESGYLTTRSADLALLSVGDLNGDGKSDIVWRQLSNDNIYVQFMNGKDVIADANLGCRPSAEELAAIADFDGDQNLDLLWRDSSGLISIQLLNKGETVKKESGRLKNVDKDTWTILGAGDLSADANADIFFQNKDTGAVLAYWIYPKLGKLGETMEKRDDYTPHGKNRLATLIDQDTGLQYSSWESMAFPTYTDIIWGDSSIEERAIKDDCAGGNSFAWVNAYKVDGNQRFPIETTKALIMINDRTFDITEGGSCGTHGQPYALYNLEPERYTIKVWGKIIGPANYRLFYWEQEYDYLPAETNLCFEDGAKTVPAIQQRQAWWHSYYDEAKAKIVDEWAIGAGDSLKYFLNQDDLLKGAALPPSGLDVTYGTTNTVGKDRGYGWTTPQTYSSMRGCMKTLKEK